MATLIPAKHGEGGVTHVLISSVKTTSEFVPCPCLVKTPGQISRLQPPFDFRCQISDHNTPHAVFNAHVAEPYCDCLFLNNTTVYKCFTVLGLTLYFQVITMS